MKANLPASQDAEARRQILDPFIGDDEALEASRIILSGLPEDQVAVQVALLGIARKRGIAEGFAMAAKGNLPTEPERPNSDVTPGGASKATSSAKPAKR